MRSILIFVFILFLKMTLVEAMPNPMLRNCQVLEGTSVIITLNNDQVLLCQIGNSLIGSLELYLFKAESKQALDIQYLLARDNNPAHCKEVTVMDAESREHEICIFSDGSILDQKSFIQGLDHRESESLKKVLIDSN